MAQPIAETALNTFGNTNDPLERRQALSDLFTLKVQSKQVDNPLFKAGFEQWRRIATDEDAGDRERLLAIAELVRIASTLKKDWPVTVQKILTPVFLKPIPPISLLNLGPKPGDDRLNVARACSMMKSDWLPSYLARGIVEEDLAENARAEMLDALFACSDTITDVLVLVQNEIEQLQFSTESPGDSMGKRLKKILKAIRPAIVNSLIDAGENVGEFLNEFLRKAFKRYERPKDEKVQIELSAETALLIHDLFRTRLSVAGEPDTFEALRWCRKFFPKRNWPNELREPLDQLIQDLSEALIFLCRQGKPSQVLLDALEIACGYKERAQGITVKLAEKHVELPEDMRNWLIRWRMVNTVAASETLQETQLQSIDAVLGMALVNAKRLMANSGSLSSQVISTLDIYEPMLTSSTRDVFGRADQIAKSIVELAKRRGLDVLGEIGEEIEVAPKYFEFIGSIPKQHGTVRQPAIVRRRTDGVIGDVVLKGVVD